MVRTQPNPVSPVDLAEVARMLRAVVEAVPVEDRLERAVARHVLAGAAVLDTLRVCLDWSTSETGS